MRNRLYILGLLFCVLQVLSCKKDAKQPIPQTQTQPTSLKNGILNFSVSGQMMAADIDSGTTTIQVTFPHTLDIHNLAISFTLASQVNATINDIPVKSGDAVDFTKPLTFKVFSADGKRSSSFNINAQNDLQYIGLIAQGGHILSQKSLNRSYDFYRDQFDGSVFQSINCGPTVTTMALKWADSTFSKTTVDARSRYESQGGWWYTGDVSSYLHDNNISNVALPMTSSNIDSLVKSSIDNGNLLILCLDMYYVSYNPVSYQHVNKFYETLTGNWGHFILVKGYVQTNNNFYLEIYDPYDRGDRYTSIFDSAPKGKDRYYTDFDIVAATKFWWQYAMLVAPKGQKVVTSTRLKINSLNNIPQARGR